MQEKQILAEQLSALLPLSAEEICPLFETPEDAAKGDFALPCFKLAKILKKAPPQIAAEIASSFRPPAFIDRMEVAGGYLNFFWNQSYFFQAVLSEIEEKKEQYGRSDFGKGKTVVLDYSSINIAKPFHIGHLSTTAIGNALYRIYGFLGYETVGINHLGDWGTQFGKLISAYQRWGSKEKIEQNSIREMLALYVRFHEEAEKNPALEAEGRMWFKRIEDGDPEALSIFSWFKELTLKEVKKVYDLLGVTFDSYAGESFYNDKMQPVIDELREKGLLEESDGAYVVRLDAYQLPPCLILKSDGTTLYATRDLAAAFYRKKTYDFAKCLYVVAYQQNLHFKQIFQVIKLMGYDWADQMEHVAFGMVSLEEGTLSTRKGRVVFLEDVLRQSIEKTLAVMNEKNPNLQKKEEVAKQVGVGAVVFSVLSQSRIKDITFDLNRVLNFDGETGPYVQYTHARACSLLRKAGDAFSGVAPEYAALENPEALAIAKHLQKFGETVKKAGEKNEPFFITRYVLDLAHFFNRFYYEHRVLDGPPAVVSARLLLVRSVAQVLKTGLFLIGIEAPEQM